MKRLSGLLNFSWFGFNKKIKNATESTEGELKFKSKLERTIYLTLVENGIAPEYEKYTFSVWDGFSPQTPFYDQETAKEQDKRCQKEGKRTSKILKERTKFISGIRYTPDFHFRYNGLNVWIEAKGMENDVFYIKKKMFRKLLDRFHGESGMNSIYFEVYSKKQLLQALDIVKEYAKSIKSGETEEAD